MYAEVQAIGAGAVNQAIKAIAIARGYLEGDEIPIHCIPYFTEIEIDGQERTAIKMVVQPCPGSSGKPAGDSPDPGDKPKQPDSSDRLTSTTSL